jgi:hypothetical protein
MSRFNREELETAQNTARISIDEETISHLDVYLFVLTQVYALPARVQHLPPGWRLLKVEGSHGPSKELKRLDKALRDWIYSDHQRQESEADIIGSFNGPGFHSISPSSLLQSPMRYFGKKMQQETLDGKRR